MFARQLSGQTLLSVGVSAALLVAWATWMGLSYQRDKLQGCEQTIVTIPAFGVDFYRHIDRHARTWFDGGDPYSDTEVIATYPPFAWRLFAWVNAFTPKTALGIWWLALTAIFVAAAWTATIVRRQLGLSPISPWVAVVAILFSTPAIFCLERGQYDPLLVAIILAALPLLSTTNRWAECAAGAILVLAPWAKVYPALLAVGLVGLRRWRALAAFAVTGCLLLVSHWSEFQLFLVSNAKHVHEAEKLARFCGGVPCPWNHSLYLSWKSLWVNQPLPLSWLAAIPGKVAAAALLGSLLAWVTWRVAQCEQRDRLAYPYLLWTVALATFVPPVSNDYNFVFLPLAVIALWDRRDPWPVQVALALLLVWWQPFGLGVGGRTMLWFKFGGLVATGGMIVLRARQLAQAAEPESVTPCLPAIASLPLAGNLDAVRPAQRAAG